MYESISTHFYSSSFRITSSKVTVVSFTHQIFRGTEKNLIALNINETRQYALVVLVLAEGAPEHGEGVVAVGLVVVGRARLGLGQPLAGHGRGQPRRREHGRLHAIAPPRARRRPRRPRAQVAGVAVPAQVSWPIGAID